MNTEGRSVCFLQSVWRGRNLQNSILAQNHCSEGNNKCREHFNFKALCDESYWEIILKWILEEVMKVATELNNHLWIGFGSKVDK
jgi:hypothetical protein